MSWFAAPDYWFARLVVERGLAAIYVIAFAAAGGQFRGLLGTRGLLPIPRYLARVSFWQAPSLFQFRYSDRLFAIVAWSGAALGAAMAGGLGDAIPLWGAMLAWLVLWALYLSIVSVGQIWYGFGWESLLLETGFLAVFLGNSRSPPPAVLLWLLRWLLLRLEFGAGLIKLRGDRCWRDLTCLRYHHETQPMPGPLSWFFHHLPDPLHRIEVLANHVAQLAAPLVLFAPQPAASVAAAVMIVTQLWLVASGNFAWLNWLTIVIAFSVVDTSLASRVLPLPAPPPLAPAPPWYEALVIAYAAAVVALSYRPARNLVSRRQLMNASFDPLRLVNSYGAFGSITRHRYELVIEGTTDPGARWLEYEFRGKPGDPRRMPPQVAPYHLRLDWLMWFAALSPAYAEPWLSRLLQSLLTGDRDVLRLLRVNPFPGQPPTYVRVSRYRYRFTTWRRLRQTGAWWERIPAGVYRGPVTLREPSGLPCRRGRGGRIASCPRFAAHRHSGCELTMSATSSRLSGTGSMPPWQHSVETQRIDQFLHALDDPDIPGFGTEALRRAPVHDDAIRLERDAQCGEGRSGACRGHVRPGHKPHIARSTGRAQHDEFIAQAIRIFRFADRLERCPAHKQLGGFLRAPVLLLHEWSRGRPEQPAPPQRRSVSLVRRRQPGQAGHHGSVRAIRPPGSLPGIKMADSYAATDSEDIMRDAALLAARLLLGGYMGIHASQKLLGKFHGPGLEGAGALFEKNGLAPGRQMAAAAAATEITGGALTITGFAYPAGPLAVAGAMTVAAAHNRKGGLMAVRGGVELPVSYATLALTLAAAGPGKYRIGPSLPGKLTALGVAAGGALAGALIARMLTAKPAEPAAPEPPAAQPSSAEPAA